MVAAFSLTTPPGFEPGQREPKSLVLPLHYGVKMRISPQLTTIAFLAETPILAGLGTLGPF